MRVRGWQVAAAGALLVLAGALTFPGAPGCRYCGQVYTSTFLQNAAVPSAAVVVGIVVFLVAFYLMGRESVRG